MEWEDQYSEGRGTLLHMEQGYWCYCCSCSAQNVVHQQHSDHVGLGAHPYAEEALILGKVKEEVRVISGEMVEEQHNSCDPVERAESMNRMKSLL